MSVIETANRKLNDAKSGVEYGLPGYGRSTIVWWTAYIEGAEDQKREDEAASPWHRVEDNPPDEKKDVIFYYEWIGIDGTVHKPTSVISLDTLIALDCRPIAWMEKPEPPKEDA